MSASQNNYNKIFNHQLFNKIIDDLTYNQFFFQLKKGKTLLTISFEDLKKCIWLSSILADSIDENHRKKVQLFASLAYLQNLEDVNITRACYLLCSRVGNLTATRLFKGLENGHYDDIFFSFDALLNYELANEWNDKLVTSGKEHIVTSKFQKGLWNTLNLGERVAISAPTSAGKSFILKKYVNRLLLKHDAFRILYIVPSKALINQVSEEFRKEVNLKEVDVKTAFIDDEKSEAKQKEIYVLTAERCLRLIKEASKGEFVLNLIFIDEIQNIEDEEGRGSLLEYVLKELFTLFSKAQIIIAGPNIDDASVLFSKIFDVEAVAVETSVSPVFQIKTIVRPAEGNKLKVTLKSQLGREQSFELETESNILKMINSSYARGLAPIIDYFSTNEQNIIYSPRTDYVETWALEYVNGSVQDFKGQPEETQTKELIEFLKEEIHPKYHLIPCLEKRAAFHHSKLPDIVRKEIEDGFLEGRIINLFCTSTLLEGVNLPANNLFIVAPNKMNDRLSAFEFGNLIGRAGRIRDCLYGTIYCVERSINDTWAEEYYDKVYSKEVKSVTEKSLDVVTELVSQLDKPIEEIAEAKHRNTSILLRHKYLQGEEALNNYLFKKNVEERDVEEIVGKLRALLGNVEIPHEVSKLNPSVDPILQNTLYLKIKEEGISQWAVNHNSNFYGKITKEDKDNYAFDETSFYWQLVSIMERLDTIFEISKEAYFRHNISASIRQICFYGLRWLNSSSLHDLIQNDIKFYSDHSNAKKKIDPENDADVNVRINEVIKINSTLVSYVLVKYLKLANDIMEPLMNDDQKEKYKFSLGLPTMLELGSTENVVKLLISRGISRSVAIKVWGEFKKVHGNEAIDIFDWLKTKDKLNLKPIYNRYLRRLKLLKSNENGSEL
ncbi:DEAD/DEAH box helicase [Flavobacterium sp. N2038]|uniref:DEAD/DEAH box helicase n=1 Tax=Flavobacterium sp. N2038 TaxID=2986829 RepID=UPI002224DBB1|nr:DEAD/DEAH box helicase [Flavobacterium sp. N2038]